MSEKPFKVPNPDAPATKRQTWAIFCLKGGDVRNKGLTQQQASDMIQDLLEKRETENAVA